MGWLIVGGILMLIVLGYVAHKFPTLFGKAVDAGAAVVNKVDDTVKSEVNKVANTSGK